MRLTVELAYSIGRSSTVWLYLQQGTVSVGTDNLEAVAWEVVLTYL